MPAPRGAPKAPRRQTAATARGLGVALPATAPPSRPSAPPRSASWPAQRRARRARRHTPSLSAAASLRRPASRAKGEEIGGARGSAADDDRGRVEAAGGGGGAVEGVNTPARAGRAGAPPARLSVFYRQAPAVALCRSQAEGGGRGGGRMDGGGSAGSRGRRGGGCTRTSPLVPFPPAVLRCTWPAGVEVGVGLGQPLPVRPCLPSPWSTGAQGWPRASRGGERGAPLAARLAAEGAVDLPAAAAGGQCVHLWRETAGGDGHEDRRRAPPPSATGGMLQRWRRAAPLDSPARAGGVAPVQVLLRPVTDAGAEAGGGGGAQPPRR